MYYQLSLLIFCVSCFSALGEGTLMENRIEGGTELRLVPAIESGVTVSGTVPCSVPRTCVHAVFVLAVVA